MTAPSDADDVRECVGDLLDDSVDLTIRFLALREGHTASAAFVLNRLGREGPTRLTTLAAKEGVTQPSMTQLVQRLERQGLMTRLPDPSDGRACLIALTPAGREVLAQRRQTRVARLTQLMETLTPEEERVLWLSAMTAGPIIRRLVDSAEDTLNPARADDRKVEA